MLYLLLTYCNERKEKEKENKVEEVFLHMKQ